MKIKKVFESKLLYSPGKGHSKDIQGFDELSNLIEDSLVDSGTTVKSKIIKSYTVSVSRASETDDVPNAVEFQVKRQLKSIPYSIGNPFGREIFKLKDIIDKQSFFEECSKLIKDVNSAIYRSQKNGYIMNSYVIDQSGIYERKMVIIKISYLVEWLKDLKNS